MVKISKKKTNLIAATNISPMDGFDCLKKNLKVVLDAVAAASTSRTQVIFSKLLEKLF